MEYTEHYENMDERNALCATAVSNGFRNIHDTFDEDWKRGDEPHGTLIFTDEPAPVTPEPEPIVFTASPPGIAIGKRLNNIEDFLRKVYPE